MGMAGNLDIADSTARDRSKPDAGGVAGSALDGGTAARRGARQPHAPGCSAPRSISQRPAIDRRAQAALASLAALLLGACGEVSRPAGSTPKTDRLAELAQGVLARPCTRTTVDPPVPAAEPPAGAGTPAHDLRVYVAHPDDEAMYGGGTLARLVRAGRRVGVVVLSHGEGGRLLEPGPGGTLVERRDLPRQQVVAVRDEEARRAAGVVPVELGHLHGAGDNVDFAWTTSCEETLRRWNAGVPGGVAGMLGRLVADLRQRRPRVVITLDPRDDPQGSRHGHHKAAGVLVELAARAAADPSVPGGAPHVVEEVLTFAPKGVAGEVKLVTGNQVRLAMLREYRSQFRPADLEGLAERLEEHFVLRWRPAGVRVPAEAGSVLGSLAGPGPALPATAR